MTAIHTTRHLAHLVADGKVVQHRARLHRSHRERCPWTTGHSHALVAPRKGNQQGIETACRAIVTNSQIRPVGDLDQTDLRALGYKTRADFARAWIGQRLDQDADDHTVLLRFNVHHAHRPCWVLTLAVDLSHQPRLLHRDPALGYTHLPEMAADQEPEAVLGYVIELGTDAAQARHRAGIGLQHQEDVQSLQTLHERLERVDRLARERGLDTGSDRRVIERSIARLERRIANHQMRQAG